MTLMRHTLLTLLLLCGTLLLHGCGQTGPLYLPEDAPEKTAEEEPAPEENEKTAGTEQT